MRKKEERLIISFETTMMAMLMERVCKQTGQNGRLIPLPTSISAGCGLAWMAERVADVNLTEAVKRWGRFMQEQRIAFEQIHITAI